MQAHTLKEIREFAEVLGLVICTWAPGDGWRRYNIEDAKGHELFGGNSREAYAWLRGFSQALTDRQEQ